MARPERLAASGSTAAFSGTPSALRSELPSSALGSILAGVALRPVACQAKTGLHGLF